MAIDTELREQAQDQAGQVAATALSSLLDIVILNQNKRKAKNIVMNSVQFIVSVIAILHQVDVDGEPGGIEPEGLVLGSIAILYAVMVIVSVMCHAASLPPNHRTTMEVEEAYKATNEKPIIDGILEIRLAQQFGCQGFCYGLWAVFAGIVSLLVVTLSISYSAPYVISSLLAVMTLYQMTSDSCEYWVHTRPQNLE